MSGQPVAKLKVYGSASEALEKLPLGVIYVLKNKKHPDGVLMVVIPPRRLCFTDLLTRLWTANAPQARAIWKEAKARGVRDELKRALAFNRKGEV